MCSRRMPSQSTESVSQTTNHFFDMLYLSFHAWGTSCDLLYMIARAFGLQTINTAGKKSVLPVRGRLNSFKEGKADGRGLFCTGLPHGHHVIEER